MLVDLLKTTSRNGMTSVPENDITRSWLPWKVNQLGTLTLLKQKYKGNGTEDSPFIIDWLDYDPENPKKWMNLYKSFLILITCSATFAIGFVTTAYIGPFNEIKDQFHVADEVIILGLSLFSLSFAITPLFWAPFSEIFGRQPLFILTFGALTAFNAGTAGSQNIWTLLILRFFAEVFGASSMVNTVGVLADLFESAERGLLLSVFVAATFLGIVVGPIVGGFLGETVDWRWVEGVMTIFCGILWIIMCLFLSETYSPVLLHKRAIKLSSVTAKVYRSKYEVKHVPKFGEILRNSLLRP
jgi:multidrug resistance protein